MNGTWRGNDIAGVPEETLETLIRSGRLTRDDLERIQRVMRESPVEFGDAVVALGLLTAQELADVMKLGRLRQARQARGAGIIERALLREPGADRSLVKYAPSATARTTLGLIGRPDGSYAESIRALRTELLLRMGAATHCYSLCVMSPGSTEGRTQLCAELAVAFSQIGRRTLLIDADLRRSRISELFDFDRPLGLGEQLARGHASLQPFAVRELPNLAVMPAGTPISNPLEVLTNGQFDAQLLAWRQQHDIIIADTPPAIDYPDALAVASSLGRVLVGSRLKTTPMTRLKEMMRRLGGTQSQVVGAITQDF